MDEYRMNAQRVQRAIDQQCASLQPNPYLAQRVLNAANMEGGGKVKKKVSVAFIMMMILICLTLSAVAVALLSGMELIEQEAVPMARENDLEARPVTSYTPEQLETLIRTASENGLILDDDSSVMQALRSGEGYYEEEVIMALCREAFGGLFYEWTVEQRHWYQDMMIAIGFADSNGYLIPGEGELPSDEARRLAVNTLQAAYGAELPLDDPSVYRREEWLYEESWQFTFYPRDLTHPELKIFFDVHGEDIWHDCTEQNWETYTVSELTNGIHDAYAWRASDMADWPQEAWVLFGQMLPAATDMDALSEEYKGYYQTAYLSPDTQDMSAEAAKAAALKDAGVQLAQNYTALLLGDGDSRVWKITFSTDELGEEMQTLSYEIDSRTGVILRKIPFDQDVKVWARYMLHAVYEQVSSGMITTSKAVQLAMEALWKELGDSTIPFGDESCYELDAWGNERRFTIMFNTKVMDYGTCGVYINAQTGAADVWRVGVPGVDGDTLFGRYSEVYGSCNDWDQAIWVKFDQEMEAHKPTTLAGRLLKQATYPDASAVKLTLEQALDIAYKACQSTAAWEITHVLIDAEPNPVWKIRMTDPPYSILFEIDAMTGEIMSREYFKPDNQQFDPSVRMYVLHKDYMPAAIEEFGIAHMAAVAVSRNYSDPELDDPMLPLLDEGLYQTQIDGRKVTFTALRAGYSSYTAAFSEDYTQVEVTCTAAEAVRIDAAVTDWQQAAALYGGDERFWPMEVQAALDPGLSVPREGEMTQEEAVAYAVQAVIDEHGQEAIDALGDYTAGCMLYRFENEGERLRWHIYITDDPANPVRGYKVVFALRNGEIHSTPTVQDINDTSNG